MNSELRTKILSWERKWKFIVFKGIKPIMEMFYVYYLSFFGKSGEYYALKTEVLH
jgi:hypothetical protein